MKDDAQTYAEIIRNKRCFDLTKYYEINDNDLKEVYNFLANNVNGVIVGYFLKLSFIIDNDVKSVIMARKKDSKIDGVIVSNTEFRIIPHYVPKAYSGSSYSGGSSFYGGSFGGSFFGGSSFSGGSSNNNNNR